MNYILEKSNGKRLSSVYLNDLGYNLKGKPDFGKLFVFRSNSWYTFTSKEDYFNRKKYWIDEINSDKRYTEEIKSSLIKSINNLDKLLTEN